MTSMTGYAYNEVSTEQTFVSVEIKSVNSRFLDLSINIPTFLGRLEGKIREQCSEKILRGKVDIYIRIKELETHSEVVPNLAAARAYAEALGTIAKELGHSEAEVPLSLILAQEGVLTTRKDYDMDRYWLLINPVFTASLEQFCADRNREGENLKKDLQKQITTIEKCASIFQHWIPEMEKTFRTNIMKRFTEILGNAVDEQRVMTETAALLVKYTINEEVVRLQSHLEAVNTEIATNPAPGRKLDFLCQELNREINTIGSKSQIQDMSSAVIQAKDALENIREQCRNIE